MIIHFYKYNKIEFRATLKYKCHKHVFMEDGKIMKCLWPACREQKGKVIRNRAA